MYRIVNHSNVEYLIDNDYNIIASARTKKIKKENFQEFFDTVEDWEDTPYLLEGMERLKSITEVILAVRIYDILSNNCHACPAEVTLQYSAMVVESKESINEILTNF